MERRRAGEAMLGIREWARGEEVEEVVVDEVGVMDEVEKSAGFKVSFHGSQP